MYGSVGLMVVGVSGCFAGVGGVDATSMGQGACLVLLTELYSPRWVAVVGDDPPLGFERVAFLPYCLCAQFSGRRRQGSPPAAWKCMVGSCQTRASSPVAGSVWRRRLVFGKQGSACCLRAMAKLMVCGQRISLHHVQPQRGLWPGVWMLQSWMAEQCEKVFWTCCIDIEQSVTTRTNMSSSDSRSSGVAQ